MWVVVGSPSEKKHKEKQRKDGLLPVEDYSARLSSSEDEKQVCFFLIYMVSL